MVSLLVQSVLVASALQVAMPDVKPYADPARVPDTLGWQAAMSALRIECPPNVLRPSHMCECLAPQHSMVARMDSVSAMSLGIAIDLGCRVVLRTRWYYYHDGDVDADEAGRPAEIHKARASSDVLYEPVDLYRVSEYHYSDAPHVLELEIGGGGVVRVSDKATVDGYRGRLAEREDYYWAGKDQYILRVVEEVLVVLPERITPSMLAARIEHAMDRLGLDLSYRPPRVSEVACQAPPPMAAQPEPVSARPSAGSEPDASDSTASADTTGAAVPPGPPAGADLGHAMSLEGGLVGRQLRYDPACLQRTLQGGRLRTNIALTGAVAYGVGAVLDYVFVTAAARNGSVEATVVLGIVSGAGKIAGPLVAASAAVPAISLHRTCGFPGTDQPSRMWRWYVAGWAFAGASTLFSSLSAVYDTDAMPVMALCSSVGRDICWATTCVVAVQECRTVNRLARPRLSIHPQLGSERAGAVAVLTF